MTRRGIAVEKAIADGLTEEASRQNKTIYGLANEFLSGALRVCREGGSGEAIFPSWDFCRILKDTDSLPIPGALIEKMMKKVYASDRKWLLSEVYDQGAKVGAYLKLRSPEFEELVPRLFELQVFLPIKRLELEQIDETTNKVSMSIHILGAGPSLEATECAEQFVKGLLSVYPYRITDAQMSEGIIEARITKLEKRSETRTRSSS